MFSNGHCQCFAGGVHAGDGALRANRSLGEHIRLAFELFILIEIFQRAEQIVGTVIIEQAGIFLVVDQPVFCGKGIVGGVQFCLRCLNILVREVQLLVNQFVDDLPQLHHTSYTAFGIIGQLHLRHNRIFSVVHLTVHHGIGEILYIWVSGERLALDFCIRNIWCFHLDFNILALNMLYRFGKLVGQHCALDGGNRQFLPSVLGAFGGQFAQNHLRVVHEILVDGKAVLGLAKLHPCRFDVRRAVTLLQKDNVTHNIRACVCLERIIRQTDSSQQVSTLCHVLAGGAVLAIHGVAAGDERHHAARTHLVNGLGEKVVVDAESQLVVRLVVDLVVAEGHVAHRQIVEITAVCGLKARHGNVGLRVQLFGDAPGDGIQLYAVQTAVLHGVRQHTEEVAHAHTRFQNVTAAETHALHRIVDTTDHGGAGVVGVQGAGTCGGILVLGEQPFQFGVFLCPTIFAGVKSVCQTAPAHIL